MPAKKKRAAPQEAEPTAAAASASATTTTATTTTATEEEGSKGASDKGKKAKVELVLQTERDPLPAKAPLPPGKGFKIVSFNVNGLKALVAKDPALLGSLAAREGADVLLLQETKLQECFVAEYANLVPGFVGFWSCSKTKKGYAGTATFVKACYVEGTPLAASANAGGGGGNGGKEKQQPTLKAFFGKGGGKPKKQEAGAGKEDGMQEEKEAPGSEAVKGPGVGGPKALSVTYGLDGDGSDEEGRVITLELPFCFVVNTYVPNSGMKLERLAYRLEQANPKLQAHLERLRVRKPVVLAGDLNVAHLDLDCYNTGAKHLPKVPGCTPQEREAQTQWLAEGRFVDAFRHLHPTARGAYTYWNVKTAARPENKGLRLDYLIVPAEDADGARGVVRVHDCGILHEVPLSDHAPVWLTLELLAGAK